MKWLLLIAAAWSGRWIPQQPMEISPQDPMVLEQGTDSRYLFRVKDETVMLRAHSGNLLIPLKAGPSGTYLLPPNDGRRTVSITPDGDSRLLWWSESRDGEAQAWNDYEIPLSNWAHHGGDLPAAPEPIPALELEWMARRQAMDSNAESDGDLLLLMAEMELEAFRARSSSDHASRKAQQFLVASGETHEMEFKGPGVAVFRSRILMEGEPYRHYSVNLTMDQQPVGRNELFSTQDSLEPGWGWPRSHLVAVPPGRHTVSFSVAEGQDWNIVQVEQRAELLRPSLGRFLAAFPHTNLLPGRTLSLGPVAKMEIAHIVGDARVVELAEDLLSTPASPLARARLVEHLDDPEQALSLYRSSPPTAMMALALARRWITRHDVDPSPLLQDGQLLPADPAILAQVADALSTGFLRSRSLAIRDLAGISSLGTTSTRWSQVIPAQPGEPIRVLGTGGGIPRVIVKPGLYAIVDLPQASLPGRFPVLRLEATDWVRYRVDGQEREGRGRLDEALAPGPHRIDVEKGQIVVMDGLLAEGQLQARDRAAGNLPNHWTIPDPGAATQIRVTIDGPPGRVMFRFDDGNILEVQHEPSNLDPDATSTGQPLDPNLGQVTQALIPLGAYATTIEAQGTAGLRVAITLRRSTRQGEATLPDPGPDPMDTLARISREMVDQEDPFKKIQLRLSRASCLAALGLQVSAQAEGRAIAASPQATPEQRAVGYALYKSTIPPVHSSGFPGPATVDAALAWAGLKLSHVPQGPELARIAEELLPPISWPLHREASSYYLASGDVVRAWIQAEKAGPLGRLARMRAAGAGDWQRIQRVDHNAGTIRKQVPRLPPDITDGVYTLSREYMLGAPWKDGTYNVIRKDHSNVFHFQGQGELSLQLLQRDETFAIDPEPIEISIRLDGQSQDLLLREGHVEQLSWNLEDGKHELTVGPVTRDGHALLLMTTLGGKNIPPQITLPAHRLGSVGVKATVAGPCLLRIRVRDNGPVTAAVDGETYDVDGLRVIPISHVGPTDVRVTGLPNATITLSRLNPCSPPTDKPLELPRPLDTNNPSPDAIRVTAHWMNDVALPDPRIYAPMERGATMVASTEAGNDSTGVRDLTERYLYLGASAEILHRLGTYRHWSAAQVQLRGSPDGAPGSRLAMEWVTAYWPHLFRLKNSNGYSGGAGHGDLSALYRHRVLLGPWWQTQPYLSGHLGYWTAAPTATVDPLAWNSYDARHWAGLSLGNLLDWRPLRDGRVRLSTELTSNVNMTLDRVDMGIQADLLAPGDLLLSFGPSTGYRFQDDDRSTAYWRTRLDYALSWAWYSRSEHRWKLSAQMSWYPSDATVEGNVALDFERSPRRGLRDHSPLDQVFTSALDLPLELP